jgi:hypothetical protein
MNNLTRHKEIYIPVAIYAVPFEFDVAGTTVTEFAATPPQKNTNVVFAIQGNWLN